MCPQEFGEAAAEGAGAVAMDEAHLRGTGESGLIEEFVHAARGFFDGAADQVDFLAGRFGRRLRADGDASRQDVLSWGFLAYDRGNVGERDFHSQRAGFDFSAVVVT